MALTRELRDTYHDLWEAMVAHPFVVELGDGTLPQEVFRRYFLQDYLFVRDLVSMTAMGVARAPDMEAAGMPNRFLAGILDPENDLFLRAFKELGVSEGEYSSAETTPTTQAFGDFMVRVGLEGDFTDIVTVLYVTEGTYLDWGTKLLKAGKRPGNPIYREWIKLHGPDVLGELVGWMGDHLDGARLRSRSRTERLFLTALRYEYLFWDAAYRGDWGWGLGAGGYG